MSVGQVFCFGSDHLRQHGVEILPRLLWRHDSGGFFQMLEHRLLTFDPHSGLLLECSFEFRRCEVSLRDKPPEFFFARP